METDTSTGVRTAWVTEQHIAPAKAYLEYSCSPVILPGLVGVIFDAAAAMPITGVLAGGEAMALDELGGVEGILHSRACWTVGLRL